MSEHKQLLQAIAANLEVDQSSVAVDTEPGRAFTLEQHRRVSFKADPLAEVRAIKQTDAPAELGAERLEQARAAWAWRVQWRSKAWCAILHGISTLRSERDNGFAK